ncbi:hypothetical protein ACL6C3_23475 [Capilliphycus salinus ALCB114379]|uniref:hypothetical protein n=1 Tax=Capilliphycus salinus TaxID=2768948 RepID=UPI0039A622E9
MNIKAIALAFLLGLSAPAITEIAFSTASVSAMPTDFPAPEGAFIDKSGQWVVKLNLDEFGAYTYEAQNRKTGNSLTLKKYTISGNKQRYTYTFKNGDYKYIIAYRPNDSQYIRLTVIDPEGDEILNRLMEKVGNDWDV